MTKYNSKSNVLGCFVGSIDHGELLPNPSRSCWHTSWCPCWMAWI